MSVVNGFTAPDEEDFNLPLRILINGLDVDEILFRFTLKAQNQEDAAPLKERGGIVELAGLSFKGRVLFTIQTA